MQRETIYSALFSRLTGSASFVTTGRGFTHWDKVVDFQPALFMERVEEVPDHGEGMTPSRWRMHVAVWVYARTTAGDQSTIANLVDSVVTSLDWQPGERQSAHTTLGNTVIHARPVRVTMEQTDEQSAALIDIEILAV